MEAWFTILVSLCICAIIRSLLSLINLSKKAKYNNLPPGPPSFPIIGNLFWLTKSLRDIEGILKGLRGKYGPIITLHVGSRPAIFVADRSLAHQALVQNGAIYSDRPKAVVTSRIISSNQHNISSALYGPTWRLLRRNLSLEILHPSRVKSYSHARTWVLDILIDRLKFQAKSGEPVELMNHFRYAMFCLLVLMCFGDKLEEKQIKEIEDVHRRMLLGFGRFNVLNFWPKISKILFRNRWKQFFEIVKDRENVLAPLIAARRKLKEESQSNEGKEEKDYVVAYVDGLLDLELPDENRKLKEDEMVSLCSEFITAGTDTTSTVLQWIMANLVKHQHVQERLYDEIKQVMGESKIVTEDDLQKMKYLKSVILEGLRRHPPGHFVLPHAVTEETDLGGYFIPKNASVNFMVAEMGWDSEVWEDPMEFKPERFLNSVKQDGFDITGSKEIKMMPFGAGRRICPGLALAMLHLEYFVANLVWQFVWKPVNDDQVDLSEKLEFTVVMKNPLQARISSRQEYH